MKIDIKKHLIATAKTHRQMGEPLSIEEIASIAADIQRKNLEGYVLLPTGPNREYDDEKFFEDILVHFVSEGGLADDATQNHRALCEELGADMESEA